MALLVIVCVFFSAGAGSATAGGPCETQCDADYAEGKAFCEKLQDAETRRVCHGSAVEAHTRCLDGCRKQQGDDCVEHCKEMCYQQWETCRDACPRGDKGCLAECSNTLAACNRECDRKCRK